MLLRLLKLLQVDKEIRFLSKINKQKQGEASKKSTMLRFAGKTGTYSMFGMIKMVQKL